MNCIKTFVTTICLLVATNNLVAATPTRVAATDSDTYIPLENLIQAEPNDATPCATDVFARALNDAYFSDADAPTADSHETDVQTWVHKVFDKQTTLEKVLECPEIAAAPDTKTITFRPIKFTFPNSERTLTINYKTQPLLLKRRLTLATRPSIDALNNPDSPEISPYDDSATWSNTEPAWYGIMITRSGALDEFVGPDKNNTISMNYIQKNLDRLIPGGWCTDWSAVARDGTMINKATRKTVNLEKDSNDYYIAGDKDLRWIAWAEVAADIVVTIVTFGAGAAVSVGTKAARAGKAAKKSFNVAKKLLKGSKEVQKYADLSRKAKQLEKLKQAGKLDNLDELNKINKELDSLKSNKNVKEFIKHSDNMRDASKELKEYKNSLRRLGFRKPQNPQRGNVIARGAKNIGKTAKSIFSGNKKLSKIAKTARSSDKVLGKTRNFLFEQTMKNLGRVGNVVATASVGSQILAFAADMYDYTPTETNQFTSGLNFKPFLLLSADDIEGQENVINYGMWLMWAGDSTSMADDDAAYLQATDFATKLHQDLIETQEEENWYPCEVDIYVVRPVLRSLKLGGENEEDCADKGTCKDQLYYLIMNDEPWVVPGANGDSQINKQGTNSDDAIQQRKQEFERAKQQLEQAEAESQTTGQ